jgi:glutamate/tyrosine decarboxylase-like PLP-dependent enzyme
VLFADPAVAGLYAHDSPYTYFTSRERHLGEISLECSRAGAAAAALWATLEALPLTREGLGGQLAPSRRAAQAFARALDDRDCSVVVAPELDIVCPFPRLTRARDISESCERAFDSLAQTGWHVAKLRLRTDWLRRTHPEVERDSDALTTLRMVLMKPTHAPIVDALADAVCEHLTGAA